MKKHELYELAKIGMRERLKAIEEELADQYREFPDLFIGLPKLLKPELLNGASNGHHVITSLPHAQPESRSGQLLPYLHTHGPSRVPVMADAMGLKGSSSLASAIARHMKAGTIERTGFGVYGITAAGIAALDPTRAAGKKKKKTTQKTGFANTMRDRRANTARMLDAVEQAGQITAEAFAAQGFKRYALGPLLHRGYLKKTRKGEYMRTGKAFTVDTRKSAQQ